MRKFIFALGALAIGLTALANDELELAAYMAQITEAEASEQPETPAIQTLSASTPLELPEASGIKTLSDSEPLEHPETPAVQPLPEFGAPCHAGGCYAHVSLEALFWDRDEAAGRTLVLDTNVGLQDVINTSDLDFDYESGFRVSALVGCGKWAGELVFFDNDWDVDATVREEVAGLFAVVNSANFADETTISVDYHSELQSYEGNVYCQTDHHVRLLAGLRFLGLDETFRMTSDPFSPSAYNIATRNNLLGGQIGARYDRHIWGNFSLGAIAKAGGYYLDAKQSVNYFDAGVPDMIAYSNSDKQVVFVGELNLQVRYACTKSVQFFGGYQRLWIDEAALAPEQFQDDRFSIAGAPPGPDINLGRFLAHGFYAGVEITWGGGSCYGSPLGCTACK